MSLKRSIRWLMGGLLMVSFVVTNNSFATGPLSMAPVLDTARAVTATISSDGGMLTATAGDGEEDAHAPPPRHSPPHGSEHYAPLRTEFITFYWF